MIIVLNNKSALTYEEFVDYQNKLAVMDINNNVILCPSTINIALFNTENCLLGSQNVSKDKNESHTGEVTARQLKSFNVKYCLVGHSERREEFKESNLDINEKIKNLLSENITPILCVGEVKKEDDLNVIIKIIKEQLLTAMNYLKDEEKKKIIVAYEPTWSIATKNTPSLERIDSILKKIKELLPTNILLYGGGVTEENIKYLKKSNFSDGYLLGSLSLDIEKFTKFLQELKK